MSAWLRRNTFPIAVVIIAAAVVIIGFELVDAATESAPTMIQDEGNQALTVGGLIKVALFLLVPASITLAVRRRGAERSGD